MNSYSGEPLTDRNVWGAYMEIKAKFQSRPELPDIRVDMKVKKARLMRFVDPVLRTTSKMMPSRLIAHSCRFLSKHPNISDSWGFHVRPIQYDEPLPDYRTLTSSHCERRREPPGIDFGLSKQIALLKTLARESRAELNAIADEGTFDFANGWYSGLDACTYYALIRHLKPRRIMEVGSGYSTRIASLAVARNEAEGYPGELICIEPFPQPRLTDSQARFVLIPKKVQEVPITLFEELSKNDILMIDSSHAASIGSDVCYLFLDILPRLRPEVWVHVHDIFFPQDYPSEWVIGQRRAYNEQYLLETFLSGNIEFTPKLANRWLLLDHRDAVDALCPPNALAGVHAIPQGTSFWMRRGEQR